MKKKKKVYFALTTLMFWLETSFQSVCLLSMIFDNLHLSQWDLKYVFFYCGKIFKKKKKKKQKNTCLW